MKPAPLYPLRFEPIYQYRLWGGRRLSNFLSAPLPGHRPVGEAWVLSDRDDFPSLVAEGPLAGRTIADLLSHYPKQLLGDLAERWSRFPLLLKFLDASEMLSVQVHPSDQQTDYLPPGERGKTEAWVVLETGPKARIFGGLTPGTTAAGMRQAVANGAVANLLASFPPNLGDGVYLPAGTVHSMRDVVVFEVQENSDVTFRLYDWDRVDSVTGKPRALQVEEAMAVIDFNRGVVCPVTPVVVEATPVLRERLFHGEHFGLWRLVGDAPFMVGKARTPRVLVCIDGEGQLDHKGASYHLKKGEVMLLPAIVGACFFRPSSVVKMLEIALPKGP